MTTSDLDRRPEPARAAVIAVEVQAVSKKLRGHQVLQNIDLTVPSGETVGIYGPNGSGKSMLLRVISGLVLPDTGMVRVFGRSIGRDTEFPQELGALIDGAGFVLEYSGLRNLELLASIRNRISRETIRKAIERVGLDPNDHRPVKAYSTGMRQRLGIAQAIMENPRLLLLDEPTSSLDPDGSQYTYDILRDLRRQGVTIILTGHDQDEIEGVCDRVLRMQAGSLYNK